MRNKKHNNRISANPWNDLLTDITQNNTLFIKIKEIKKLFIS